MIIGGSKGPPPTAQISFIFNVFLEKKLKGAPSNSLKALGAPSNDKSWIHP